MPDSTVNFEIHSFGNECLWTENTHPDWGTHWQADCGPIYYFDEDTPADNCFKFCPFCGKPLKQVDYQPLDG